MIRALVFILLTTLFIPLCSGGQPIPVDENSYEELISELDFSATEERLVPRQFAQQKRNSSGLALLGYLAIVLVLTFLLRMIRFPQGKENVSTMDDEHTLLHNSASTSVDLYILLASALEQQDFREAIRIQFNMFLLDLEEKKLLVRKPEHTNRDYLRVLRGHPIYESFKSASQLFERSWYANRPVKESDYWHMTNLKSEIASVTYEN